jgi:hypothetical protein
MKTTSNKETWKNKLKVQLPIMMCSWWFDAFAMLAVFV